MPVGPVSTLVATTPFAGTTVRPPKSEIMTAPTLAVSAKKR